jgi:UDP-hydrolysing UDP-N-acetyl-D-glucosamine 2-epimerase
MKRQRTIGVVTVGRSDFGIYRPVLAKLSGDSRFNLQILVGGMHLSPKYGETWRDIEREGFRIAAKADGGEPAGSASDIAAAMGAGLAAFGRIYASQRPDILLVLGDRYEMFAAAAASVPYRIPLAHIHGGETTEGAMDEVFRHSMTKMSHLHFVSTEAHGNRVRQMGEEPWRITVCGAPGLDAIRDFRPMDLKQLAERIGMPMDTPPLLVTFHPATLVAMDPRRQIEEVLVALSRWRGPIIFTGVNADTGGDSIRRAIDEFVARRSSACYVENLGTEVYFSLMKCAAAMVGNSSSGLIEAPSLCLPVVNIGPRQQGRTRGPNVIDVFCEAEDIAAAIDRAAGADFRRALCGMANPYGDGHAAERISDRLADCALDSRLIAKKFYDLPVA